MNNKWTNNDYLVIVGATSGLGTECVQQWLNQGGSCLLIARNQEKLQKVISQLTYNEQQQILSLSYDAAEVEQTTMLIKQLDQLLEQLNKAGHKIVGVINCIGYGLFANYFEFQTTDIQAMFQVNTLSLIELTNYFAQYFSKQKAGHIMNVISMAGKLATPKSSIYSATKFALIGYINSLRLEVAHHNVYVTAVNLGPMATVFFEVADPNGSYLDNLHPKLILQPQQVATKMIKYIGHNKRELNLPWYMNFGYHCYQVMPKVGDYLTRTIFNKK